MSQLTIMSIILMGTKMMSMGMSMMLMVTQVLNYEKTEVNGYVIAHLHSYHICQH